MDTAALLREAFGRVSSGVHSVLDGMTATQLAVRPAGDANHIGWLIWHLTRIQDDHVADAFGREQVWTHQGWSDRFGLPFDTAVTGYGQDSAEVAQVQIAPVSLLIGYHDAVHARTLECLGPVSDAGLDRIVDRAWNPPVTLGVRLVSVISDDLQHLGQAAYVKGLLRERPTRD